MCETSIAAAIATAVVVLATAVILRIVHVIRCIQNERRLDYTNATTTSSPPPAAEDGRQVKTMAILGSGGHTTEMIRLLRELDPNRYAPVIYVVADSDVTSIPRLERYIREDGKDLWAGRNPAEGNPAGGDDAKHAMERARAEVHRLPRAREVGQSYVTSIFTTLHCFVQTLRLVWRVRPELILANGPGTCVPIIYTAFLFRILFGEIFDCKIVFVESLCRVKTLSLSGRMVYPFVDRFVVHWPCLKEAYKMVEVSDVFVRHDWPEVCDG